MSIQHQITDMDVLNLWYPKGNVGFVKTHSQEEQMALMCLTRQ